MGGYYECNISHRWEVTVQGLQEFPLWMATRISKATTSQNNTANFIFLKFVNSNPRLTSGRTTWDVLSQCKQHLYTQTFQLLRHGFNWSIQNRYCKRSNDHINSLLPHNVSSHCRGVNDHYVFIQERLHSLYSGFIILLYPEKLFSSMNDHYAQIWVRSISWLSGAMMCLFKNNNKTLYIGYNSIKEATFS